MTIQFEQSEAFQPSIDLAKKELRDSLIEAATDFGRNPHMVLKAWGKCPQCGETADLAQWQHRRWTTCCGVDFDAKDKQAA